MVKIDKSIIDEIRSKKAYILNDATVKELNNILKIVFPTDLNSSGGRKYYFASDPEARDWNLSDTLPSGIKTYSVTELTVPKQIEIYELW